MPLYSAGLWEAEMTAPACVPRSVVRNATPGVVHTPRTTASPPAEQIPATRAAWRNSPEARVSRPTATRGRVSPCSVRTATAAPPRSKASRAESSVLATPRTPSVPKSLLMPPVPLGSPGLVPPRFGYLTDKPMTTSEHATDTAGRLVQVFATTSIPEGLLAKSLLEAEGIPVVTKGESEGPYRVGPVYLLVWEGLEVQARLILAEA